MSCKPEVISREDAFEKGLTYFFTGSSCKNNHIDKRYTNTGVCYQCKRDSNKRDAKSNPLRKSNIDKRSYVKNKDKRKITSCLWDQKNRLKSNAIKKSWKLRNLEKYQKAERDRAKKYRLDPNYRISRAISRQIWGFLKGRKNKRKWESFLNYSFEQLKEHLENKFDSTMTWDNYGTIWEIDHIVPQSWFKDDDLVHKIWSLENLQPLSLHDNRSKRNRYAGSPSKRSYKSV